MSLRKSRREFLGQIKGQIGFLILSMLTPLEWVMAASKGSKANPTTPHKKSASSSVKASVSPTIAATPTNRKQEASASAESGSLPTADVKPAPGAVVEPSINPEIDGRQLIDPTSLAAIELVYVEKHADVLDEDLRRSRQGVAFENQLCSNCLFYKSDGVIAEDEVGKCKFFAKNLAKSTGWCKSWAKKF